MDKFKKFPFDDLTRFEKEFGKMMREFSPQRFFAIHDSPITPATDIYETDSDFIIYMEIAGLSDDDISITATSTEVTVSGVRRRPRIPDITGVHQLEVETGKFERTLRLSSPIDPGNTTSTYQKGCLLIRAPKKTSNRVEVEIKD
ncbi:MAG: Hsp20/alpha crystallin family protein [Desulfurivibrionaceae bacterium]